MFLYRDKIINAGYMVYLLLLMCDLTDENKANILKSNS